MCMNASPTQYTISMINTTNVRLNMSNKLMRTCLTALHRFTSVQPALITCLYSFKYETHLYSYQTHSKDCQAYKEYFG